MAACTWAAAEQAAPRRNGAGAPPLLRSPCRRSGSTRARSSLGMAAKGLLLSATIALSVGLALRGEAQALRPWPSR